MFKCRKDLRSDGRHRGMVDPLVLRHRNRTGEMMGSVAESTARN
jgi:hypothetical protein